jgi:hypothetical protein
MRAPASERARGRLRTAAVAALALGTAVAGGSVRAPQARAATGDEAHFTLSASQLLINQRIGQAAIRRLSRAAAIIDGRPAPAMGGGGGGGARVTLSARQLLINQRIFQAAVRRAAGLEASMDARPMPRTGPGAGGTVRLTVGQLVVNQRIAQAAVRRADALARRLAEGRGPVARATPEPIPTSVPTDAQIRFCGRIAGVGGRTMQAWRIVLADGEFAGCHEVLTTLGDYYRLRPRVTPGSPPAVVDGATCDQFPRPDLPQVMCVRRGLPFFSAWPQT